MGRLSLIAMPSGRLRTQPLPRQEIVNRHVLMCPPGRGAAPDACFVERAPAVVEALEGAAHREIARSTDVAAPEVAREKPFRRPAAEAPDGGERLDHPLVRGAAERSEV